TIKRATILAGVAAWEAVVLLPSIANDLAIPQLQPIGVVSATFYFFAVEVWAAARMALDSRRRLGVARLRLASAAIATGLYGAALLLAGITSVIRGPAVGGADSTAVTRTMALIATIGYLAAFAPPGWFRRFVNRAASFPLVRTLVAPPNEVTPGSLWSDLARTAQEILGARRVSILPDAPGAPLAVVGDPKPAGPSDATDGRAPVLSTIELAIRPHRAHGEHLVAEIEGRPLFVSDDLAVLADLCALTAQAIDREETLISLGEARREAEESRAVRASEARFRALLDADPNAILALDEESRISWATRQAGELFGAPVEQL